MSGCAHGVTPVQGSLFYPTRNFATLGMLLLRSNGMVAADVVRSFLPDSPCRHEGSDCTFTFRAMALRSSAPGVQSLRIPLRAVSC